MPYIFFTDHGVQKHYKLPENRMAIFGREDHTDFQIQKDSLISREHFAVEKDERGNFLIIDLGSSNGTYLNDKRLESNSTVILKDGDKIRAGRQTFTYHKKMIRESTAEIVKEISQDVIEKGKGFHTIMCEILGKDKNKE